MRFVGFDGQFSCEDSMVMQQIKQGGLDFTCLQFKSTLQMLLGGDVVQVMHFCCKSLEFQDNKRYHFMLKTKTVRPGRKKVLRSSISSFYSYQMQVSFGEPKVGMGLALVMLHAEKEKWSLVKGKLFKSHRSTLIPLGILNKQT